MKIYFHSNIQNGENLLLEAMCQNPSTKTSVEGYKYVIFIFKMLFITVLLKDENFKKGDLYSFICRSLLAILCTVHTSPFLLLRPRNSRLPQYNSTFHWPDLIFSSVLLACKLRIRFSQKWILLEIIFLLFISQFIMYKRVSSKFKDEIFYCKSDYRQCLGDEISSQTLD